MTVKLKKQGIAACELPHPRVVAIDNKKLELENIRDGLLQAGIPCVPLLYDETTGLQKPEGLRTEHLRYIFTDLNLNELEKPEPTRMVDPIADALQKLNILGAYILIFWTKYPEIVKEVMILLKDRCPDIVLPFFFETMDKSSLNLPENPKEDDPNFTNKKRLYDRRLSRLIKVIINKLSCNDMFKALLAWENKVSEAASASLKTLHDKVRKPQESGVAQDEKDFCRLLKKLGANAWGNKPAKENWGRSVASGLNPFLSDNLDFGMSSDSCYNSIWERALNIEVAAKLPKIVSPSSLNTACILDVSCKIKEAHGIWLEFVINHDNRKFVSAFGVTGRILMEEFVNFPSDKALHSEIESRLKLGLLDITRACDYTNRKHGLRRFVLCAILPLEFKTHMRWPDQKESPNKKHEAILDLPSVSLCLPTGVQQESILQVNFKYVLSLPDKNSLLAGKVVTPRFRVRRQALTDIIFKFSAHTTSPGFFSFK